MGIPLSLKQDIERCRRCGLHRWRKLVVPGRGPVPAKVLLIGEGPGQSENIRGLAFIGPTKPVLDAAAPAAAVLAGLVAVPSCFYANVVCCRPCDGLGSTRQYPNRPPTAEEARACWPNLERVYLAVQPRRVVFLGRVPAELCSAAFPGAARLRHPAYVNRRGGVGGAEYRAFVRDLSEVFRAVVPATAKAVKVWRT